MTSAILEGHQEEVFRHEALFYAGDDEFVARCGSFVREGLDAGESVLVLVIPRKIELLRSALGNDANRVVFGDMAGIGRNPSRIIPVWHEFFAQRAMSQHGIRGIGEPIWVERNSQELIEAQRHESLINLAFAGVSGWILCPYDTDALGPAVIEEAHRSHPFLMENGTRNFSSVYEGVDAIPGAFDHPLPEPATHPEEFIVQAGRLDVVRNFVAGRATAFGLDSARIDDLMLAVNEVATNSLRHASGDAVLRVWHEGRTIVFEMRDGGRIDHPMIGRMRPSVAQEGGLGLWLVNQLCDLVQVRSFSNGSVVRLHMSRD